MKILITTGIYPPEIGGPAEYAKNIYSVWKKSGFDVHVSVFSRLNFLPTGIRHIIFFLQILPRVYKSDFVLSLDTFSCALPTVLACKFLGKKNIIRTGGDFLWESYVERTGDMVLLRDFYETSIGKFSLKERVIFKIISFILSSVDAVIWSTNWQRDIFIKPYRLQKQKHFIVENYFGTKSYSDSYKDKSFIASSRDLKWKNVAVLKEVFRHPEVLSGSAKLVTKSMPHEEFIGAIKASYAVILASLGDISPNTILDAIMYGKPFIVTRETGLYERIKDIAIFIDPKDSSDIAQKVIWLLDEANYLEQKSKVQSFVFTHTWEEIAGEYLDIYKNIK